MDDIEAVNRPLKWEETNPQDDEEETKLLARDHEESEEHMTQIN